MADVGEIWNRARRDRAFREQLERDPASALAGAGLTDDELALLDAALRASRPSGVRALFAVRPDGGTGADDPAATTPRPPSGGGIPPDRKEPS